MGTPAECQPAVRAFLASDRPCGEKLDAALVSIFRAHGKKAGPGKSRVFLVRLLQAVLDDGRTGDAVEILARLKPAWTSPKKDPDLGEDFLEVCRALAKANLPELLEAQLSSPAGQVLTAGSRQALLATVARAGFFGCARLLADSGADLFARAALYDDGSTPVMGALEEGREDFLLRVMDQGGKKASPLNWGPDLDQVLRTVAENGLHRLMEAILKRYPAISPNCVVGKQGERLLQAAVNRGDEKMLRTLLRCGAKPNLAGEDGWTAVHDASSAGRMRVLDLLRRHGADLEQEDARGRTPLFHAVFGWRSMPGDDLREFRRRVEWWSRAGVDFRKADYEGRTILDYVLQWGHVHAAELLIVMGGFTLDEGDDGQTYETRFGQVFSAAEWDVLEAAFRRVSASRALAAGKGGEQTWTAPCL
jgi:hypothetical protein